MRPATAAIVLSLLACAGVPACFAQTAYPSKLVRIVNPVAAGGNQDVVARAYAEQFARNLGQQFVVESRPGNSAVVGTRYVKT